MKKCDKCGASNLEESIFCSGCGSLLEQAPAPAEEAPAPQPETAAVSEPAATAAPTPPSVEAPAVYTAPAYTTPASGTVPVEKNTATLWLILNIVLAVVCCGNILGIIGLIFAAIGTSSYGKGNYEDMRQKTKVAKILFIVGIILGAIGVIIALATGVLASIANISSGY